MLTLIPYVNRSLRITSKHNLSLKSNEELNAKPYIRTVNRGKMNKIDVKQHSQLIMMKFAEQIVKENLSICRYTWKQRNDRMSMSILMW